VRKNKNGLKDRVTQKPMKLAQSRVFPRIWMISPHIAVSASELRMCKRNIEF